MNINKIISKIKKAIDCDDVVYYKSELYKYAFIYIDGMIDKKKFEDGIVKCIIKLSKQNELNYEKIISSITNIEYVENETDMEKILTGLIEGKIIFISENLDTALIFSARKVNTRSIMEPPTETVVKGPREGFTEELQTNITMIRRRIKDINFRIKYLEVGVRTKTKISICYIDGICDKNIVDKIKQRLEKIKIDGVVDSSYISAMLEEKKLSIFNQAGHIEKPDIVASKILEGRVALIVDGSPIIVTIPFMFIENFQDSYDYYSRSSRSTMLRMLRIVAMLSAVFVPALYISFVQFHYQLLPVKFLVTIENALTGIPFPPTVEQFIVLILFELLNQASTRMPKFLGVALSVVGAIVLGDTAVSAGLISSPAVLIIAISAIGINCLPDAVDTFSILRIVFLIVSSLAGLFGVLSGTLLLVAYLSSLSVYGTPYFAPYAPVIPNDLQDGFFKNNNAEMEYRPISLMKRKSRRMK